MSAIETEPPAADALVVRLDEMLAEFAAAAADCTPVSDAVRIDRIARLEKLRAATAALQAAESVRFAQSQAAEQVASDVHPDKIGRGIAEQLGLACRISPVAAARRLNTARAWWFELPDSYRQLMAGELSERVADAIVTETRHLDAERRRQVDDQLRAAGIAEMGVQAAMACVRKKAYEADPRGYVQRGRTERQHRRVGIRPAPDTMAILTGYLPVEQGIACYAALQRHADTAVASGDGRTKGQIMADTLVERLTGQASAADVNVELQVMVPIDSLVNSQNPSAMVIPGFGPLPGDLGLEIVASSNGAKWWRRLFTGPKTTSGSGPILGGDPRRRHFDRHLTQLIKLRDQTCRDPYCDAPIRHIDHIQRHSDGGSTSYGNGRGTCERGNYTREMPGWHIKTIDYGLDNRQHKIIITTPTGHHYHSRAPDPP
jgi:hypothetical protein